MGVAPSLGAAPLSGRCGFVRLQRVWLLAVLVRKRITISVLLSHIGQGSAPGYLHH